MTDGWPATVPVAQIEVIEGIGWDALMMVNDGRFSIERDSDERPIGLRFDLKSDWWVVVVNTEDGFSVGRFRAMIPFEWVHGVPLVRLADELQRAAAAASLREP